jgi:hypothetical protein
MPVTLHASGGRAVLTIPNPLLDDECAAFDRWRTQKTQQGRAHCQKQPPDLIRHLPGSLFAQFLTQPDRVGGEPWRLLTVRDTSGGLFRTAPPVDTLENAPLSLAANALYIAITHATISLQPSNSRF